MSSEWIILLILLIGAIIFMLWYEKKIVDRMYRASRARINRIYDSVKGFLFLSLLENTNEDPDPDTDIT